MIAKKYDENLFKEINKITFSTELIENQIYDEIFENENELTNYLNSKKSIEDYNLINLISDVLIKIFDMYENPDDLPSFETISEIIIWSIRNSGYMLKDIDK